MDSFSGSDSFSISILLHWRTTIFQYTCLLFKTFQLCSRHLLGRLESLDIELSSPLSGLPSDDFLLGLLVISGDIFAGDLHFWPIGPSYHCYFRGQGSHVFFIQDINLSESHWVNLLVIIKAFLSPSFLKFIIRSFHHLFQ